MNSRSLLYYILECCVLQYVARQKSLLDTTAFTQTGGFKRLISISLLMFYHITAAHSKPSIALHKTFDVIASTPESAGSSCAVASTLGATLGAVVVTI